MAAPTKVEIDSHYVKAVLMAILSAGDQVAGELAQTANREFNHASTAELKARVDRIWVEAKK